MSVVDGAAAVATAVATDRPTLQQEARVAEEAAQPFPWTSLKVLPTLRRHFLLTVNPLRNAPQTAPS